MALSWRRRMCATWLLMLGGACQPGGSTPAPAPGAPTGPLTVTAVGPSGEVTGPLQGFATFDKPIARLGELADAQAAAFLQISPALPGQHRFLGTQTVVFEPSGKVPRSSRFTLTVPASARSVDGSGPAAATSVEFTTLRLALLDTEPGKNFRNAGEQHEFQLRFNQPVNLTDLSAAVSFQREGARVAATCQAAPKDAPDFSVRCKPVSPLPVGAAVNLVVDAALHGAEGPLTMKEGVTLPFQVHGALAVEGVSCEDGCRPEMGARLNFSTPVVPKTVRAFIQVDPPLKAASAGEDTDAVWGEADYATTSIYLPNLRPSTAYAVTVKAGFTDQFGQKLDAPQTVNFRTGPATPSARVPGGFLTMEPGNSWIPVRGVNAGNAKVELWRVSATEAPALAQRLGVHGNNGKPRAADLKSTLDVSGLQDKAVDKRLDLSSALTNGRGLVGYRLAFPGVSTYGDKVLTVEGFAQVTPLAVTLKTSGTGTLVWVTQMGSATPVADASVELSGEDGRLFWTGTTDADGLAQGAPAPVVEGNRQAVWARVASGEDVALGSTTFDEGLAPWDLGAEASWSTEGGDAVGLLVTDRGVYRPGETVHVKAVLRLLRNGELELPPVRNGTIVLTGPTGEDVARKSVTLSALGTTSLSVPLDRNARLGTYSLEVNFGDEGRSLYTSVQVEEFKAPDFKVEVSLDKLQALRGESLQATARTLYLFGAPLPNAASSYSVSRMPTSFAPPFEDGWVFGDDTRWLEMEVLDSRLVSSGTATTAADGSIRFHAALGGDAMPTPENALFEVTTVDPSGQSVTGRATALVHPGAFYLGLKTEGSMLAAGTPVTVNAVALKPDGSPASAAVKARLLRREYKAVKQQGLGDSQETVQTAQDVEVSTCDLAGVAKEPRSCQLTAKEPGLHILALESKDAAGNPVRTATVEWVYGKGSAPWATDETLKVNLIADRKSYQPGQTARVLIQNPFPEAEALLTVERGGIFTRQVLHLSGSAPTVEIPVEERYVPNVFVGVVLLRGRQGKVPEPGKVDQDRPAVRGGYVKIPVGVESRKLHVTLTPDAAEHGPRDTVRVKIAVKDAAGAPAAGEVTLLAVDEAVLQLTAYKTPDPLATLYASRGLSVRTADSRVHLVSARSYGEKGEAEGGGGLGALLGDEAVRGRFLTCAYFNPAIAVGPEGSAEVSFELPDNLTSFRLMALAVGGDNRFGSAQGEIRVKKPLMLRPAASRLLRLGDEAEIGAVIVNGTGSAGSVEVRVENGTPHLVSVTPALATVNVPEGASVPVRFKVTGMKTGMAQLRLGAKLGSHKDGLEVRFPVSSVMPMVHDATYGEVKAGTREQVPLGVPAGALPDVGGLTLALSSSLLSELGGVAVQLHAYPYECAEQTASRVLPLLELGALRSVYAPTLTTDKALAEAATAGVQKILRFQGEDGGFAFWAGMRSSPWLTGYALLVLDRARQAGQDVPSSAFKRGVDYAREALKEVRSDGTPALPDATAVFLVDVLITLREDAPAYLSRLYEKKARLSLESRALLAHAAAQVRSGTAMRVPLTEDLLNHVHQSAKGATVQADPAEADFLASPVRTHALVLRALLALEPRHPLLDKLATGLLAARSMGRYRTTQEAAWALMALHDFQATRESEDVNVQATATLAGKPVAQAPFTKRSLDVKVETFPLADARQGPLEIAAAGTGSVRYGATLSYAPGTLPREPLDRGMFIQRTLATADGKPLAGDPTQGTLLRFTVELATPMDRNQVAADIPVPAGLELVNARFANAQSLPPVATPPPAEGEDGEAAPAVDPLLQTPFDHVELRDDRLLLFAERLPRGVHRYVVGARVVTPGHFAFAPARVEEMYTPEVFGLSPGSTLQVQAAQPQP